MSQQGSREMYSVVAHGFDHHWALYVDGLIVQAELVARLEAIQVRGAVEGATFVGYDYAGQRWIKR